jgi:hypothetical protein
MARGIWIAENYSRDITVSGVQRMKIFISTLLLPLLLIRAMPVAAARSAPPAAGYIQQSQAADIPLKNRDVLEMVKAHISPEIIVAKIKASACEFETTPAILQHLKADGVPDEVLLAMVMAPRRETNKVQASVETAKPLTVKIPFGTIVEVESAFNVSSQEVRTGDAISFRVVYPVMVDGRTVIEPDATATGRVLKASRGGHFGRAGRLAWNMEYVTAVDGTKIPLQSPGRIVGDSKAAKVVTQTIITGALLWVVAPVALLNGFKRGENAILPAGKRFEVIVQEGATVSVRATQP